MRAYYTNNMVEQLHAVGFSIDEEKRLLHGHKMSCKVMELVLQYFLWQENNKGHIKGKNVLEVMLFDIRKSLK